MAGLQVLRIINEPTAAALAYGMTRRGRKRTCLVYDLGGGTFDVTILAINDDELNVLSIGGDHHLGGKDFDDRIMNYVEEQIKAKYDIDISEDKEIEAELRLKCEAAKRQLTGRAAVPIALKARRLDEDGNDTGLSVPAKIELTREILNDICGDLLGRTEMQLESVFAKADMTWQQIDDVLLVGGSSRMPMVSEMLQRVSGKKPLLFDPDECVAKGAALQAALLSNNENVPRISVGHVLSHSLGVAVMRQGMPFVDHVVPSLTRLPVVQAREGYTTTVDDQTTVQIRVYEGESTDLQSYGKGPIGVFDLDTSPPRPRGRPKISVEFRCDENGRIMAFARDRDTGQESRTTIALQSSLTGQESMEETRLLETANVS